MAEYTFGKVTTDIENLEPRIMTHEQYESYKKWSTEISTTLKESATQKYSYKDCMISLEHIKYQPEYESWKYGSSTLAESGCAIFCIEHGSKKHYSISSLTEKAAEMGYYEPGKGTWHHLFDRLGAIRLSYVQDIFSYLETGKIVTVLYEHHFLNLVGVRGTNFLVEDPMYADQRAIPITEVFEGMRVAWAWKEF